MMRGQWSKQIPSCARGATLRLRVVRWWSSAQTAHAFGPKFDFHLGVYGIKEPEEAKLEANFTFFRKGLGFFDLIRQNKYQS